ncbi:hypothetical protein [Belnapia rosea]|uniref:Uncharacterized protein n=1 Tax=Belnapia rosea TaxID=938405 RepID=A0A1G6JQF5_9PROT|nr:hypothetical protein [Belnapia rosea]SDB13522.1 hypothetical protein SAMN02927895_00431 [Belnapia rosea]SDC20954.1 hypothetical protein SAMN04487779_1001246 [Belnapia rosea]
MPIQTRSTAPIHAILAAMLLVAQPLAAAAQGTAPAQGVTRPIPRPAPETPPPAPKPGEVTDGRPRTDQGGGAARTGPGTTAQTPLPPPNQANPPNMR